MDEPSPAPDFRALSLRWIPDDRPPGGQWSALLRLSAAIRRTIDLMADTDAPEADLLAAAEAAEAFADRLAGAPRGRRLWGFAESSNAGNPRAMFDNSPLMGLANPIAPPMRLAVDDDGVVRGTAVFGTAYEGPPGHLHGGFVAAAFDEVLGMVQVMSRCLVTAARRSGGLDVFSCAAGSAAEAEMRSNSNPVHLRSRPARTWS